MIQVTAVFNGQRELKLHPPEERDVKLLDLMLADVKTMTVEKIGSDYVLKPITDIAKSPYVTSRSPE